MEQSSSKRKKLRGSDYKRLDPLAFRWFLSQRCENFSFDAVFIKDKALQYDASDISHYAKYNASFIPF